MPKAYSLDLRERVAGFVEAGHSRRTAASHFAVSVSFVVKLISAFGLSGRLDPKPSGGRRHAKLEPHRTFLLARVGEQEDITMPELAGALAAATGTKADPASLSRWLIRHGYRFKKNPAGQRARSPRDPGRPRRVEGTPAAKDAAGAGSAGVHR